MVKTVVVISLTLQREILRTNIPTVNSLYALRVVALPPVNQSEQCDVTTLGCNPMHASRPRKDSPFRAALC